MRITVIGSSGSVSGPDSATSSYLVEAGTGADAVAVIVDLGSGAYGQARRCVDPGAVDAVLLSHLHADHVVDLAALEVHLKYAPTGPYPKMPLYGPDGTGTRLNELAGEGGTGDDICAFDISHWALGESVRIGPLSIEPFEARHPVPAFALRITGPSSRGRGQVVFTYTGDTDSCESVIDAAADADLLLSEAAFEEGRDTLRGVHLTGRRAGELATAAGARRLALTHIPPWTSARTVRAEACTAFSGAVDVAEPGVVWEL